MKYNQYLELSEDGTRLIRCDESAVGEVVIPDGVTGIGRQSFKGCSLITSIVIPRSMYSIFSSVFQECFNLKSFIVDEYNRYYYSIDGVIYSHLKNQLVRVPLGVEHFDLPRVHRIIEIGNFAFSGCSKLISVKIPNTITTIGAGAFKGCTNLTSMTRDGGYWTRPDATSIEIPSSITEIANSVFEGCTKLESVDIPSSVTKIGNGAFKGCSNLTSINFPNSITKIENFAFSGCLKLFSVEISCLTNIADNAFESYTKINKRFWSLSSDGRELVDCDKNASGTINLSLGITRIGDKAFQNCNKITAIEIPSSVTSIGDYAFSCCSGLKSIEIPSSVTKIGHWAFEHCTGLSSIAIPSSVIETGCDIITGCTGIKKIIIDKENPRFCTSNGVIYSKDQKVLVHIPESLDSFVIPNQVKEIGDGAFACCSKLSTLKIPNNVTEIGLWAFSRCTNLTSIVIPNSIKWIKGGAFADCIRLSSISIPNSVTLIGDWAFKGCAGLTFVSIPSSVTEVGRGIFDNCKNLREIHFRHKKPIDLSMSFSDVDISQIILYVPIGSGYDYRHHPFYTKFAKVLIEE